MNMSSTAAPAAAPEAAAPAGTDDAILNGVFGLGPSSTDGNDDFDPFANFGSNATESSEAPTPPASPEPAGGVAAPSPPAAPPAGEQQAPATPPAPLPPLAAPAQSPAAPATPAPAPAGTPTPEQLELASLRAQVAQLTQQAQQAANPQAPAGGQPAAAPSPTSPDGEAPIQYGFQVPQQLAEAIFSEDGATAVAGLNHLINSLATNIHQRLRQETQQSITAYDQRQQQARTSHDEATAQRQMQDEYYAAYPAHNNPLVKQVVAYEAGQLATQYPGLAWGAEYMGALGARVNAALAAMTGTAPAPAPAAPTPPAPAPAPRPAGFAPTQARSGMPSFGASEEDVIDSTFAFGSSG